MQIFNADVRSILRKRTMFEKFSNDANTTPYRMAISFATDNQMFLTQKEERLSTNEQCKESGEFANESSCPLSHGLD